MILLKGGKGKEWNCEELWKIEGTIKMQVCGFDAVVTIFKTYIRGGFHCI
jgi:hypothetical protein